MHPTSAPPRSDTRFALPRVPPLIRWLFAADLAVGALAVLNAVVAWSLGVERSDFLRSGGEANFPTWFATLQLAAIAVVLVPVVVRDVRWRRPETWGLILGPALFAALSLDEAAMVHERIGAQLSAAGLGSDRLVESAPWLIALAPLYGLVAVGAVRAWAPYLRGRPPARTLLVGGALLLAGCAVGLEALTVPLAVGDELWVRGLSVVEETGELVAGTLLLWGALRLAAHEGVRIDLGPGRSL